MKSGNKLFNLMLFRKVWGARITNSWGGIIQLCRVSKHLRLKINKIWTTKFVLFTKSMFIELMEISLMCSERPSTQNVQTILMNLVFQNVQRSKTIIKHFNWTYARMKSSRKITTTIRVFQSWAAWYNSNSSHRRN